MFRLTFVIFARGSYFSNAAIITLRALPKLSDVGLSIYCQMSHPKVGSSGYVPGIVYKMFFQHCLTSSKFSTSLLKSSWFIDLSFVIFRVLVMLLVKKAPRLYEYVLKDWLLWLVLMPLLKLPMLLRCFRLLLHFRLFQCFLNCRYRWLVFSPSSHKRF